MLLTHIVQYFTNMYTILSPVNPSQIHNVHKYIFRSLIVMTYIAKVIAAMVFRPIFGSTLPIVSGYEI